MKKFNSIELGIPADMTYKGRTIKSLTSKTKALKSREGKKAVKLIPDNDNKVEIKDAGTVEDGKLKFGTAEVEIPEAVVKRGRKVATLTPKTKAITSRKGEKSIRLRGTKENKVSILSKGQEVAIVERILKKLDEAPIPKKDISALKAKFQMAFKRHGFKKAVEQMRNVAQKYAEKEKEKVDEKAVEEHLKKLWRSQYGTLAEGDKRYKDWDFYDRYERIKEYITKAGYSLYYIADINDKISQYFERTDFAIRKFDEVLKRFKRRGQTSQEFKKFVDDRIDDTNKEVNKILDKFDFERFESDSYKRGGFKEYQERKPRYFEEQQEFRRRYEKIKDAIDSGKIGNVIRAINYSLDSEIWNKRNIDRIVQNMRKYNEGTTKRGKLTNEQIAKQMKLAFDNIFMDNYTDEIDSYFKLGQKELNKMIKDNDSDQQIRNFLNSMTLKEYGKQIFEKFHDEFISDEYDILTILSLRRELDR